MVGIATMTQDIEEAVSRMAESSRRRHPFGGEDGNNGSNMSGIINAAEDINNNNNNPLPQPPRRNFVEDSPRSSGLPLTVTSLNKADPPKLIHPILLKLPLHFRFGCIGLLSNILFILMYNSAVAVFSTIASSTIYSVVYLIFIPLSHAMNSILVFGWPERYFSSLLSNFPIGLTAIAIGAYLTAYLDIWEFNERIEEYIRDHFTFSRMPPRVPEERSEFYSSLLVVVVTGIWTYILSVYINSQPTKSEKKEL
jgi:hypothetical protein